MTFSPSKLDRRALSLTCSLLLTAWLPVIAQAQSAPAAESTATPAEASAPETWNVHGQATYIFQRKPAFIAAYTGAHSLAPFGEHSYTLTTTAFLGVRPWAGGEIYFNPEAAQGTPLSNLNGLGGYTNGEMARSSSPQLKPYLARLFLRQTWNRGGGSEAVESGANQLAGTQDKRRWVLTAGHLSVPDLFDNNAYSHDPRSQFMNWAISTHGAYDFAADERGYTWGAALEYIHDNWAVRFGRFLQPQLPNQQALDYRFLKHYGDQLEIERGHTWGDQLGKLKLLVYRNRAVMSRWDQALAVAGGGVPDIDNVRNNNHIKWGVGLNLEQAITPDVGVFARAMWADGQSETYAYTEIDRSASAGVLVKGTAWKRPQDSVGVAVAVNGLSQAHRNYLAAGGMGFFLGDGALNYKPETILESYYSLNLYKQSWASFNWQHIQNPAYNAARGPVNVFSVRLHAEF